MTDKTAPAPNASIVRSLKRDAIGRYIKQSAHHVYCASCYEQGANADAIKHKEDCVVGSYFAMLDADIRKFETEELQLPKELVAV